MFVLQAETCWSAQDSQAQIAAICRELSSAGLRAGQILALRAPVSPTYLWTLLAAWSLGALVLPLNPNLPEAQLMALFKDAKVSFLVGETFKTETQAAALLPTRFLSWYRGAGLAGTEGFVSPEEQTPVSLILTSGSSGQPKLAQHAWANHLYSALGSATNIPLKADDAWLLSLPLYHVGGLAIVVRTLLAGARLCLPGPQQSLEQALHHLKPSHLSLVPTQLYRLLQNSANLEVLRACRAILLGGSALPADLLSQAHALGLAVHSSYGATEMASQITTTPPGAELELLQTAGFVLPHRELCLNAEGEILVRGHTLFMGYRTPEGLSRPLTSEGWFATRDRARWTSQGALQVLGRLDHLFISGGENIQPEEIEAAILRFPGLVQVLVVPYAHAEYGQRPLAFVAGQNWHAADLKRHLRQVLPAFKVPDYFLPWPARQVGLKPSREEFRIRGERAVREIENRF